MSKIGSLLAIPVGLYAIKSMQKYLAAQDEATPVTPEPLIDPQGGSMGPAGTDMDIAPLFPDGLFISLPGLGGTPGTGTDYGNVPFNPLGYGPTATPVPDFSFVEGISSLDFSGLAGLKDFNLDLSGIGKDTFTTGFFDPEYQANLREYTAGLGKD